MEKICECKAICVFRGAGVLILTNTMLSWNKSASSFLLFGIMATQTENTVSIPLSDIAFVEKYTFLEGGGMKVTTSRGEIFKFSIMTKKAYSTVFDYINARTNDK